MFLRATFWGLAATVLFAPSVAAQDTANLRQALVVSLPAGPPTLSPDCRSKRLAGDMFRRPLPNLRKALRRNRPVTVMAIGSSSTVGIGASSPSATYVARLEKSLEGAFKGLDFEVVGRGLSGEVAQGAADRMKKEVEQLKPDLVVWQVGTNDAIRHVSLDRFKDCLRTTIAWLKEHRIDVVLIDPQYGEVLTKDEYYEKVVAAIADVAHEARVLLVDRFEAMRELHRARGDRFYLTSDNLHMNDTGHRCMAEQLARSIVGGLLTSDADHDQPVFSP